MDSLKIKGCKIMCMGKLKTKKICEVMLTLKIWNSLKQHY